MVPVKTLKGIEEYIIAGEDRKIMLLLVVKPSDEHSSDLIAQFNYYHYLSADYCTIFAAGYSSHPFSSEYTDAVHVCTVDGVEWWYSDRCFVEFIQQLSERTSWEYCGEIEVLVLQDSHGKHSKLDFRNYVALDFCRGLREGYMDSIPRFMQSLIKASENETSAKRVIGKATRLSPSEVAKSAISDIAKTMKVPATVQKIIADKAFYRSANRKR